jgi:hypothetical protein
MSDLKRTMILDNGTSSVVPTVDAATNAINVIEYEHHEIHAGSSYLVVYSVANLGAMSTPNDMIQLSFATPNTAKWMHMVIMVQSGGAALFTLTEAPTGGMETPTGTLPAYNKNRNSTNTSGILSATDGTAGVVSYDGTAATGGAVLWSEYVGQGTASKGEGGGRFELILKQNTVYAVSLYDTTAITASIMMDWYEHTNKA